MDEKLSWKLQAHRQEFFWAEQVSWNRGTSINISCTPYKRRAPQGKIFLFFSKIFLNLNDSLTHRCSQTGQYFPKLLIFVYFQKRQGKPRTLPLFSCTPKLIHFLKIGWYNTNFFFKTMSKCSKNWLLTFKIWVSHG